MFRQKQTFVLMLVLLLGCRGTTESEKEASASLDERIQELVRLSEVTGLSIAVVRDGAPEWVGTYGVKHAETGEPIQDDTMFEAASLSKPVFAYAVHRRSDC